MPTKSYATPAGDLAAWQSADPAPGHLPPFLRAFIQGGTAPTLGARGPDGRPLVGAGVACRVEPDGLVRVLAPRGPNAALLAALEASSAMAVTFSRARDHGSIQLKSMRAGVAPARPGDACEAARQCAVLQDELVELGYTRDMARAFVAHDPEDLVSVELRPERIFTQTPGPGAGAELTPCAP